jgi:hypothetical protein
VRLIAGGICALATGLVLVSPSAALADINAGDPTASYARSTDQPNCTGTNRMPVEVVFENFSSPTAARIQIGTQTQINDPPGWTEFADSDTKVLNMDGPGGVVCQEQSLGRVSETSSSVPRTLLRLWPYPPNGPLGGAAVRQHPVTDTPGCSWATNPGGTGGYTDGRQRFEQAFEGALGANRTYGPYPLKEYDWGNTASFQTCDGGGAVASDGNVAIIQPKDNFGYNDRWPVFSPNADPDQDPFQLAQDQGVTVVRYAANWNSVGINGSNTTGLCNQRPGNWMPLDNAYERLTGHMACTDGPTPDPPATPIQPLLYVRGAPSPHARWWDAQAGTCTSTVDPSTPDDPITAVVADNAAANDAWTGFVQNVADRYQRAKGIEIWNEPNVKKYWGNCTTGAARYAEILQLATDGIEASSHPNIPIVLGSMSPNENADSQGPEWRPYLENVAAALGTSFPDQFDVMGLHPYRSDQDVTAGRWFPAAAQHDVDQARTLLGGHQAGGKPIWVTEVGATTAGNDVDPDPKHVISESQQAKVLRDVYQRLRNEAQVPMVIIHRFSDSNTGVENPGYGVIKSPDLSFAKKAAYYCLKLTRGQGGICPS